MPRSCVRESRPRQVGKVTRDARAVMQGAAFGFIVKLLISFVGLLKGTLEGALVLGQRIFYLGGDISVALLGVGLIVQLNIAALVFLGGALGWLVALPLLGAAPELLDNPVEGAYTIWSSQVRYIGVGAMVVGGIATIVQVRHGLLQAVQTLFGRQGIPATAQPQADWRERDETAGRDISLSSIVVLTLVCVVLIGCVYYGLTQRARGQSDNNADHAGHGVFLHCGGELHCRARWELKQSSLRHDDHRCLVYRRAAPSVWV